MAKPLILESLAIQGFRTFKHLQIGRLGRVNLVTGKNNVGKSYLLEALSLYAHRGSPSQVLQLMHRRDEIQLPANGTRTDESDLAQQILNIKHLFHGRCDVEDAPPPIQIGPIDDPSASLLIGIGWFRPTGARGMREQQSPLLASATYGADYGVESPPLSLMVQLGAQEPEYHPLAPYFERRWPISREKTKPIPSTFIGANGLEPGEVASLWDTIALTDLEQEVLAALRIIAPDVERVTLVGEPGAGRARIPIVRVPRFDMPVPLRSMGEGMVRLLGIALALVSARDGLLLVDEVDSGLYHSVQPDLWRLIFQVARRLNVQVFATTHSWDCVAAFQQAAGEDDEAEGLLISLRRRQAEPERVVAVLFDEQELATVTQENIEVR